MDLGYRITADISDVTAKLNAVKSQIAGLQKQTINVKGEVNGSVGGLAGGSAYNAVLSANLTYHTFTKIYDVSKKIGKTMFDATANAESFMASITQMVGPGQAGRLNEKLQNFAKNTPFSYEDTQDASRRLLAYGYKPEEIMENMKNMGNLAALLNKPFGDIAFVFGTLKTADRMMARDMRQFQDRGIRMAEYIAKVKNVSVQKVQEMLSAGLLKYQDAEDALKRMNEEGGIAHGQLEKQAETLGGKYEKVADSYKIMLAEMGKANRGLMVSTLDMINEFIEKQTNVLKDKNNFQSIASRAGVVLNSSTGDKSRNSRKNFYIGATTVAGLGMGVGAGSLLGMGATAIGLGAMAGPIGIAVAALGVFAGALFGFTKSLKDEQDRFYSYGKDGSKTLKPYIDANTKKLTNDENLQLWKMNLDKKLEASQNPYRYNNALSAEENRKQKEQNDKENNERAEKMINEEMSNINDELVSGWKRRDSISGRLTVYNKLERDQLGKTGLGLGLLSYYKKDYYNREDIKNKDIPIALGKGKILEQMKKDSDQMKYDNMIQSSLQEQSLEAIKGLDYQVGRPRQVNINIKRVNGIENYKGEGSLESNIDDIALLMSKAMLMAVNDANKFNE